MVATVARMVPLQPISAVGRSAAATSSGLVRCLVTDVSAISDSLRQRLQLALGSQAELRGELRCAPAHRAFAGVRRSDDRAVIVTVHPAPPAGPAPDAVRDHVVKVRELEHELLELPLAHGDLDGRAWVLEAVPPEVAALDRLHAGPLPLAHAVSALRDLARALTAAHRRGITHGAINLETVRITTDGARLSGIGRSMSGSVRGDLDAVGEVAWSLLTGETDSRTSRPLSKIRRGIAPSLEALCVSLRAPDPRHRPQRAEAILDALDAVPTRRSSSLASIVDVGLHDVRPQRAVAWLVVGAALFLVFALLQARV